MLTLIYSYLFVKHKSFGVKIPLESGPVIQKGVFQKCVNEKSEHVRTTQPSSAQSNFSKKQN